MHDSDVEARTWQPLSNAIPLCPPTLRVLVTSTLTKLCTSNRTQTPILNLESFARWLAGVQEKKRTIEALRLSEGREDTTPLEEMEWTEDVLRTELQRVLIQNKLNALDLVRKFDKDASGEDEG